MTNGFQDLRAYELWLLEGLDPEAAILGAAALQDIPIEEEQ